VSWFIYDSLVERIEKLFRSAWTDTPEMREKKARGEEEQPEMDEKEELASLLVHQR